MLKCNSDSVHTFRQYLGLVKEALSLAKVNGTASSEVPNSELSSVHRIDVYKFCVT